VLDFDSLHNAQTPANPCFSVYLPLGRMKTLPSQIKRPADLGRALLSFFLLLATTCALVSPAAAIQFSGKEGDAPSPFDGYGRVLFQAGADSPHQIYIVGQSHRSALSGKNGRDTVQVQAEIYRIGEWLVRKRNVELILPEGYFQRSAQSAAVPGLPAVETPPVDNLALEAEFNDPARYVSADMLLNSNCNLRLGQVEDRSLYQEVRQLLEQSGLRDDALSRTQIWDTQRRRTVAMLQNIPQAVEEAFREGRICNRRAMFTIGLAHLGDIIELLKQGGDASAKPEASNRELVRLLDQGYGVTVIVPRTLAENTRLLRLAGL